MDEPTITFERPLLFKNGKIFTPRIFDAHNLEEKIPLEFNCVLLTLPSSIYDDLDWEDIIVKAQNFITDGFSILWHLDFDLFKENSLFNIQSSQTLSLELAIEHFLTNIWEKFHCYSLGVTLYKGTFDFSECFNFNSAQEKEWSSFHNQHSASVSSTKLLKKVFCYKLCLSFFLHLKQCLGSNICNYLLLDAYSLTDPIELTYFLTDDLLTEFCIALSQNTFFFPLADFVWAKDVGTITSSLSKQLDFEKPLFESPKLGVCIPKQWFFSQEIEPFNSLFNELLHQLKLPFRLIREHSLTTNWENLDYLIVVSPNLSFTGKRQIAGFLAAGGQVVSYKNLNFNFPTLCWNAFISSYSESL